MQPQTIIIVLLIICLCGISCFFFIDKMKQKKIHKMKIAALSQEFTIHSDQIRFRRKNLDCYNFLKFNLNDALIIQPEIQP